MSRSSRSLATLALSITLLASCNEEEWSETLTIGPVTYTLTAGTPLDLAVLAELDARNGTECGALYRTLYSTVTQDAPGASIAVVIDGNVDVVRVDLQADEKLQLGDAWNFVSRSGGGCITDTGLQLLSDTDQTVELTFEIVGREAGPSGNHPGDNVFSVAIDPV